MAPTQAPALRSTRSALNPRVTLITSDRSPSPPPPVKIKVEQDAWPSTPAFTSLRRATRSLAPSASLPSNGGINTGADTSGRVQSGGDVLKRSALNLDRSKYEFTPSTPSPRKKQRIGESPAITPVKDESVLDAAQVSPVASGSRGGGGGTPKSTKKPMPQLALAKPHPPPPRWEEQYRLIERMREGIVAPVDDMGCERPRTIVDDDPKTRRFHILISLMLSSQTKDQITSQAVSNLHETLPGGLTARSLADASLETVQGCINKVGFWRRKADYIQDAARALLAKEGDRKGDVPNTLEGLCELKGVGPKMAFLALQCAWDINAGIGVDVHVHRITNRLRWHRPPTTTPEGTRLNLQSWLPAELHKPINPLLVGFGQVICLPVGPRCDICLLGQRRICPSRVNNVKSQGRKEVSYTFSTEDEDVKAKVEVGYERPGTRVVPLIDAEAGLVRMKDEPAAAAEDGGCGVKMERDEKGIDRLLQEPGMKGVGEVLEVLDEVDGSRGVDGEVVLRGHGVAVKQEQW